MSFQTILNIHQTISINNRRTVGQQYSRSGQIRVAQYLTTVPWVFVVRPHEYLYYPDARDVIQSIDNADRQNPQYITFNTSSLEWFTKNRGTCTVSTTNGVQTPNTQTLSLTSNGTFKEGDFLQIGNYVYKVTADSAGSLVNIHRPLIGTPSSGTSLVLGKSVQFYVVAEQCPTYTLTPMTNGAYVRWNDDFVFREYITG